MAVRMIQKMNFLKLQIKIFRWVMNTVLLEKYSFKNVYNETVSSRKNLPVTCELKFDTDVTQHTV